MIFVRGSARRRRYLRLQEIEERPAYSDHGHGTAGRTQVLCTWVMEQATDYLRGDVWLKGGITSCMKTAHVANIQMNYEVHGTNSVNNIANCI